VAEAAVFSGAVGNVLAVTGAWRFEVEEALSGLGVGIVFNPDYGSGMASSIKAALSCSPDAVAAVFLMADQPLVSAAFLDDLIAAFWRGQGEGAAVVAPSLGGQRRSPADFDLLELRKDFEGLSGDAGGREIIRRIPALVRLFPADGYDPRIFVDFDTREEYRRLVDDVGMD
jgi:molybdenum cofactor cytidylyltransferase